MGVFLLPAKLYYHRNTLISQLDSLNTFANNLDWYSSFYRIAELELKSNWIYKKSKMWLNTISYGADISMT